MELSDYKKDKLFEFCKSNVNVAHSLIDYVENHAPVGNFLEAVLTNNLSLSIGYHDDLTSLEGIVKWLWNYVPINCHGKCK